MSSKRVVVTGGTDGMGRAIALDRLRRRDEVTIIGRSADKGAAVVDLAARSGAAGRAHFVQADLSSVAETRAAIEKIRSLFPSVDALVLCARHFRSTRAPPPTRCTPRRSGCWPRCPGRVGNAM